MAGPYIIDSFFQVGFHLVQILHLYYSCKPSFNFVQHIAAVLIMYDHVQHIDAVLFDHAD